MHLEASQINCVQSCSKLSHLIGKIVRAPKKMGIIKNAEQIKGHKHERQLQKGATFFRTCFNGINTLTGIGLLSIPYALSQGGWLSIILLFIVAILSWYTGLLIQRCLSSNPHVKTYPDIGELAFRYKGRLVVSTLIYLELYMVAVEFLILEGNNLEKMFPNFNFGLRGIKLGAKRSFIILTGHTILPTTWLRSLGSLAYISLGGVFLSVIIIASICWVGVVDGVGFRQTGVLWNWSGLPTAISIFSFCFCAHAVFPTLCSSMQDKSRFPKVLIVCYLITIMSYGSMGIIGYLMYGQDSNSQVTLSLPKGKISSMVAICATLLIPLTKYTLVVTPIASALEDISPYKESKLVSVIIRTVLVASTIIVALALPFFSYILAFTGSLLSIADSVLIPCLCYLKINSRKPQKLGFEVIFIIFILFLGTSVAILGTYISLKSIVDKIKQGLIS